MGKEGEYSTACSEDAFWSDEFQKTESVWKVCVQDVKSGPPTWGQDGGAGASPELTATGARDERWRLWDFRPRRGYALQVGRKQQEEEGGRMYKHNNDVPELKQQGEWKLKTLGRFVQWESGQSHQLK